MMSSSMPRTLGEVNQLKIQREAMHSLRARGGDLNRLCEHATGFATMPLRIKQVDVEREHHTRLEAVTYHLDGFTVRGDRVVAIAGIFQRGEAVAVDTALADAETTSVDLVLHGFERR